MPQSLSLLLVHLVFSTKDRLPLIGPSVRAELHGYLAEVARNMECECFRVGGMADHVHLAIGLSRTVAVANLVKDLKTSSSKWMKGRSPELYAFAWQRGYGAFSVAPGDQQTLLDYINNQEEHHRTRSFQEEFRAFLNKYNIEYDERYVWD
ncbi:MAG: IS200/IS605 family transposase [Verrucomicrobiota bacterium]